MKPEFESLFNANPYNDIIESIRAIYYPGIRNETNPAVEPYYESIIRYIKISTPELLKYIEKEKELLVAFAKVRYDRVGAGKKEYKQEFNPDEVDEDEIIAILPYYKDFFFTYIVEFFYLNKRRDKLLSFLKKMRYPQAKIYAEDLIEDYNNALKMQNRMLQ